jgi:hypothetical protein
MPPNPDDPRSIAWPDIRPSLSAEDRFARVVEASPTALVLVGPDGRIEVRRGKQRSRRVSSRPDGSAVNPTAAPPSP